MMIETKNFRDVYPIDWGADIEAYRDGETLPIIEASIIGSSVSILTGWTEDYRGGIHIVCGLDGTGCVTGWRIRNVRPDLTARMEKLVREIAASTGGSMLPGDWQREARAIIEMLPKPKIDPDLVEARKIVAADLDDGAGAGACGYPQSALDGDYDKRPIMAVALAAIKRGRELERGA